MKNLRLLFLFLLAAAFVLPARAGESSSATNDLAQLQGEWLMASGSADGQPMPDSIRQQMKRVCRGDEATVTMGGQIYLQAKFTLDPSKQPKTIDYAMTGGFTKGQKQLGIYEVDGDTFKSSFAKPVLWLIAVFLKKAIARHLRQMR